MGIRPEESVLAARVSAVFLAVQMSHAFSANAADGLFLTRFGVENLPIMIALAGSVTAGVLLAHAAGLSRFGAGRWLPLVTGISASFAVAEWTLNLTGWRIVYAAIWVTTQAIIWLTFATVWNAASVSVDTRQAKRLFPLYASAGVAGAIIGNLLTGPIASSIGTGSLLLVQAALLAAATVLLSRSDHLFGQPDHSDQEGLTLRAAAKTVVSVPLIRLVAAASVALWALFYMVIYPFNEAVSESFNTDAEIAGFLGLFSSVATGATFVVSLFLTRWLLSRLGVVNSLLLVPVVYAAGFAVWLGAFGLPTAATVRGAQWVVVTAVGGTALMSLFNVLPGRQRGQVSAFVTAVPAQLGIVAGGLIVLVGPALGNDVLFISGLVMSVVAAIVVWLMRPAYVEALVAAVQDGLIGVFRVPTQHVSSSVGKETLELLAQRLRSDSVDERLVAIAALDASGADVASFVEPLLDDPDPRVRTAIVSLIASQPDVVQLHLEQLVSDEWPLVRRRALEATSVLGADARMTLALQLLDDPHPSVVAEAARVVGGQAGQAKIDSLLNSSSPDSILAALEGSPRRSGIEIDAWPFVDHPLVEIRMAALGHLNDDQQGFAQLRSAMSDPAVPVRKAAAKRLSESTIGCSLLVESLQTGSFTETDVALTALNANDLFDQDVMSWARAETSRAAFLERMRSAVATGKETPATEYLVNILRARSQRISDWVISALRTPENGERIDTIERGIWSDHPSTRAQAYEALDAIGDRNVTGPLLALLERNHNESTETQEEALDALTADFDSWIRDLAVTASTDLSARDSSTGDSGAMADSQVMLSHDPDEIARMIALHKVEMFAGLDPEDLALIASAATEVSFVAGEQIYEEGETADEMLVIVSGDVVVSTTHDGTRQDVARYGPGEHVGELALLRRSTRSADVTAGDQGLVALNVKDFDLRSVLEDRPRVAMAMLETLANRLAEQT